MRAPVKRTAAKKAPGRPRREEARDTRGAILDAALDLFADAGFAATSMRQLAKAVDVRESTLYHHFPSKEAILAALVADVLRENVQSIADRGLSEAAEGEALPLLLRLARQLVAFWTSPREARIFQLMLAEAPKLQGTPLSVRTEFGGILARLTALFAELVRRGKLVRHEPELLAHQFLGPLVVLRILHVVGGEHAPERLRRMAERHVRFFCSVFAP